MFFKPIYYKNWNIFKTISKNICINIKQENIYKKRINNKDELQKIQYNNTIMLETKKILNSFQVSSLYNRNIYNKKYNQYFNTSNKINNINTYLKKYIYNNTVNNINSNIYKILPISKHIPTLRIPQVPLEIKSYTLYSQDNTNNTIKSKKSIKDTSILMSEIDNKESTIECYDQIVIGGGSGGMATAKEAAKLGAKVLLFDFVKPSTKGTRWGLGGTCVNVGCIPKKQMHYSATIGMILHNDSIKYGWNIDINTLKNDWNKLVNTVQDYIHSQNFSYKTGLRTSNVKYINSLAKFVTNDKLCYTLKGKELQVKAKNIVIATGSRPIIPKNVPGAQEYAITSDDIFSLENNPGKTLVVGASYIALECAGFLNELGYDTTVAVRSIVLRNFDQQCAEKLKDIMMNYGIKFISKLPIEIKKNDDNRQCVSFSDSTTDIYDTVLYAIGRYADTHKLDIDKLGIKTTTDGKILTNDIEQTNIPNIYAIGDILDGKPELTPVAIRTGEILARRLFNNSKEKMNWNLIPTTVFTPIEYGTVGLSEEAAIKMYGDNDIETYLFEFTTLEHSASHREKHASMRINEFDTDMPPSCLAKQVCIKSKQEQVVGFHFIGPNAGEITQGYALALSLGAKKSDFDSIIGIHPTDAEAFTSLSVTRSSGENWVASGGCGGGKCG